MITLLNRYPIYLGYLIPDYKHDLEDKLQTYNKLNGFIQRNFGKQNTKETKLRIHNVTAKAVLKFSSEARVLKTGDEKKTGSITNEIFETPTRNY
jgi:hypothetical protein